MSCTGEENYSEEDIRDAIYILGSEASGSKVNDSGSEAIINQIISIKNIAMIVENHLSVGVCPRGIRGVQKADGSRPFIVRINHRKYTGKKDDYMSFFRQLYSCLLQYKCRVSVTDHRFDSRFNGFVLSLGSDIVVQDYVVMAERMSKIHFSDDPASVDADMMCKLEEGEEGDEVEKAIFRYDK
jgi:hypothetical protein